MKKCTDKLNPFIDSPFRLTDLCTVIILLCIAPTADPVKIQTFDVQEYMDTAMEDFISDLRNVDLLLTIDIYTLADKTGSLSTYDEIEPV